MSEFNVIVVPIDKVARHPNADTLSITQVIGDYPVIFKTGDIKPNSLAVYIPIEALVPLSDERFAFLRPQGWEGRPERSRIKAKKLRGIFSMGMLLPIETLPQKEGGWQPGDNVQSILNITKYEPEVEIQISGAAEADNSGMPIYDIEALRRYPQAISVGEEVIVTEKLDGTNARFVYKDGRLWVGSHRQIKRESDVILWWKIARKYNLEEKLKELPNIALYGEIYGPRINKLNYGKKEPELAIFDALDLDTLKYFNHSDFFMLVDVGLGLPTVPELYLGPYKESLKTLANGNSVVEGANHIKEGIVIKPTEERWEQDVGRVILKFHSEEYLLMK